MSAHAITESEFQSWVAGGEFRRAAEWLVQRYADEVMGMCMAVVRDRSTAEDLVQDVFSRAFVGLKGFRAEASSRTWLLTIARNRCFDHLRAKRRQPWGATHPDATIEPDDIAEEAPMPAELLSRRADVEAALGELAEGDRALIVLRFRSGLDYTELAIAFGLKPGTVRMRVSRALARMRSTLEQREELVRHELMPAEEDDFEAIAEPELDEVSDDLFEEESEDEFEGEFEELLTPDLAQAPPEPQAPPAPRAPSAPQAPPRQARRSAPPPAPASAPAPVAAARVEHPLSAFFAVTHDALSSALRARLVSEARNI